MRGLIGKLGIGLAGLWVASAFAATNSVAVGKKTKVAGEDIFAATNVLRIQIVIPSAGLNELRHSGWGNGVERPTVKATVKEGGTVYTNVAIHLKGAAGSFRSVDDNPAITLNFDYFAAGQTFHGLRKISLNNSVQDRSFLSERICRELFEAAGVPVPRAGFATLRLNGRELGLRVMTEGFNKQFLKRYFNDTSGNLYDGGFLQDISGNLSVTSGDNPRDHSRLRALRAAVTDRDTTNRFARIEQVLDVDRFLSFLAMEVIQCHWDGYAMNRNNWRIYHDLDSNRMVFFPHGLDQMFGVARAGPDVPIFPHMQGLVATRILQTPQGRQRYLARITQLYTNVFNAPDLLKRVDELAAVVQPAIAQSGDASSHQWEVSHLKDRIAQRAQSLDRQLTVREPPQFAADGSAKIKGWHPSTQDAKNGQPVFRSLLNREPDNWLYISAPNGPIVGSWRTRVQLEAGDYRFEGNLRTKDVRPRPGETKTNGGAGLRISGGNVPREVLGTVVLQPFSYPFQVPEGGGDVELVCELRASGGEAWFDANSLRVIRVAQ